jgi:hypothetical protein
MKLKNILTKNSHPNSHVLHVNFSLPNLSNLQLLYRPQNIIMAAALVQMGLCLTTVGFTVQGDHDKLHGEGLTDLVQLKRFTDKDIRGMAITLVKKTPPATRLQVGMVRLQPEPDCSHALGARLCPYQYGHRPRKLQRRNYAHCT